ncbi:MBL fold metallo-hydrolase [Fictibacillus enclensis]|uniref:MBL fold metallo-hydrolase n=1 Tax=Fictibacillus enclensis TaxID=1017270 RepID=UPI0024C0D4BC|nr:MBL fold metallo-hydrolase [Fictibacillus enclensis]WHY73426.1 MBL fold metallo-hydrolase [Fictibacillus enclensis]
MRKLANGAAMLDVNVNGMLIHPVLEWDEKSAVLIDTGVPGQLQNLRNEMETAGVPFQNLTHVILTHQDIDHIGSLPELQDALGQSLIVYAHETEKPFIEGDKPLIKTDRSRLTDEEFEALPEMAKAFYEVPAPASKVHIPLKGGEELELAGGISVIFTPGHSPGHISLYLKKSNALVAGDSMYCMNGVLYGPHKETALDLEEAEKSIQHYTAYHVEQVVCYHGGLCSENAGKQLQKLIHQTPRV